MKKIIILIAVLAFVFSSCAVRKDGCPGSDPKQVQCWEQKNKFKS